MTDDPIVIEAGPDTVWAAVGDFADGPMRMSAGAFVGQALKSDDEFHA